jgi:DNA-directed RNA polymerase subunit RPC12/RpoP
MTSALEVVRREMVLDPLTRTRVEVDPDTGVLKILCVTCDDAYEWSEADRWWACQTCGIELTPREAEVLLKEVKRVVGSAISDARTKRGRWHWVHWLLGRRR